MFPQMLFYTWFTVDGCYWIYWHFQNPEALAMMREANFPASLALYGACGLVWYFQGSLREMAISRICLEKIGWDKFIEIAESRIIRIPLLVVAILLFPFIYFFGFVAIVFFIKGLVDFNAFSIYCGTVTIFGVPGYMAACYRLFLKHQAMSNEQICLIRYSLYSGILATFILLGSLIFIELGKVEVMILSAMIMVGSFFLAATPARKS